MVWEVLIGKLVVIGFDIADRVRERRARRRAKRAKVKPKPPEQCPAKE
jgi:hypothetical protein